MKSILAIFSVIALLHGCGNVDYTITGHYDLEPGDSVFLFGNDRTILAAGIMDADTTFTLEGRIASPDIASLSDLYATIEAVQIFLEPGIIRVKPQNDRVSRVTGTPLNDRCDSLNRACAQLDAQLREEVLSDADMEMIDALTARRNALILQAIGANRDNLLGADLFRRHESSADPAAVRERLARFSPEIQTHPVLQEVLGRIEAIERTRIGRPYTDLALQDAAGAVIPLSSIAGKGRWILLDFRAAWCNSCSGEIACLRKAYRAYEDRGFEIYGVWLDNDSAKWQAFTAVNEIPWINVSGVDADKSSTAAATYGITSLPANFLISPAGTIVAKNLEGPELEKKLAGLIDKKQ